MGENSYPTGDLSMPEPATTSVTMTGGALTPITPAGTPAISGPPAPATPPAATAGEVTSPADVDDRGFPPSTRVDDMKAEEQVAYWRFMARKHEGVAKSRGDYEDLKRYREEAERSKLTDTEKAIQQARAEGAAEVTTRTLTAAAVAIYRAGLAARGVPAEELNDLVDAFNAGKFVKDGDIDTDRIAVIAARTAGTAKADGKQWPDMGQGRRPSTPMSGREAGQAEAERRFGKPA